MSVGKKSYLQLHSGSPNGRERRELDFYPTPPEVTHALMQFLKLPPMTIWEPACGDKSMSNVLEGYGHNVISTDITLGVNYLYAKRECDAIITNPPFNLSADFIEKALKDAVIVAMLLKSQYWHAKGRYNLFMDNPPAYVLPLTWRPDFLWKEKRGKATSPTMEMCWTVWIGSNKTAEYIPLQKPEAITGQQNLFENEIRL